ncbi:CDP-glycerol glycerophosphotransferase family protein [Pectobacterium brasiliense]|uniref:CDP-glycerol glycerophosphotransferase family protein n=1 Tax=Pectobacterium brasiliense TaxID=180957 RepID=UPI0032EF625C
MRYRKLLPLIISSLISSLIPKNKNIFLFSSWMGLKYSDNPKYLMEFILKNKDIYKNIKCVWIVKNKEILKTIKNKDIEVIYFRSLKGIWYQLRAKVIFFTHSVKSEYLSYVIGHNTLRIQTWHGVPLKKIGFDDFLFTNKKTSDLIKRKWFRFLMNEHYDFILSTGKECTEKFSTAFLEDEKNIIEFGFPRNDVFLKTAEIIKSPSIYKVIYMPTFRGKLGAKIDLFSPYGFSPEDIDKMLKKNNISLTLRMHPVNYPNDIFLASIKNCKNIILDTSEDIYDSINKYDCLISDYSSIIFDFLLTEKPIIFTPFDKKTYLENDREFYYSYEEIAFDKVCIDWMDVLNSIIEIKKNGYNPPAEHKKTRDRFHKNKEFNSSELIIKHIIDKLK